MTGPYNKKSQDTSCIYLVCCFTETLPPSEDRGVEFHDRIIYTEDEKISLSLELCAE